MPHTHWRHGSCYLLKFLPSWTQLWTSSPTRYILTISIQLQSAHESSQSISTVGFMGLTYFKCILESRTGWWISDQCFVWFPLLVHIAEWPIGDPGAWRDWSDASVQPEWGAAERQWCHQDMVFWTSEGVPIISTTSVPTLSQQQEPQLLLLPTNVHQVQRLQYTWH